ncbi:MAG: DNA polymerase IV [Candidatus Omnitrophota bacterium]
MILHIDMDAFFASIEQRVNPQFRGKPLIVGSRDNKNRTVVCASSYEAKAYGINSGMQSRDALRLCPWACFVPSDSAKYSYVSHEIFKMLQEFSPHVEHTTIDEFDLELDGLESLFGSFLEIGKRAKKRIQDMFGLTCSIGIAPTWHLAKLGTKIRKPNGLILINESNVDSIINALPVEKICGIGPATTALLNNLGIKTCGQLKEISEEILINNFGKSLGHWLYAVLRFDENISFHKGQNEGLEMPKSIGHSYTLPKQITDPETIKTWLKMLSEMVAERLRKSKLSGRTVSLWVNSANDTFFRQKTYLMPIHDGWEIFQRANSILTQNKAKIRAVRALGVTLSSLAFNNHPPLLTEQKRREALLDSIDKINAKYGTWAIAPAALTAIKNHT